MESTNQNGVKKTVSRSPITLDNISKSQYQKEGTLTAQIRQVITTVSSYPSKKVTTNMQQNIFDTEDFGFADQVFESEENRIAWIDVPEAAKAEDISKLLAAASAKGAVIYRVLANAPVLTDDQKYSIEQGQRTMDDYANTQVVRLPKTDPNAGQIALDNRGNVQYRRTFFWKTPQEDIDARLETSEVYMSPEIAAELQGASVMQGQSIL